MCTPHVAGSSVAFLMATAFGPGLMFPVIALPVPVQLQHDVRRILFGGAPVAAPGAFQRMTKLRQRRRGHQQGQQQIRHTTDRNSHRRSSSASLLYNDWNDLPYQVTIARSMGRPT